MKQYNYIYLITNKLNGKIYIGKHSTDDLDDGYFGSGKILRQSFKKYGQNNFTKEYLGFCDNEDTLNYLERFYIRKYKAQDPNIGYNLTPGGDGGPTNKGRIMNDSEKEKHSKAMKGKHHSEETKQKISISNRGKHEYLKQINTPIIKTTKKYCYRYNKVLNKCYRIPIV